MIDRIALTKFYEATKIQVLLFSDNIPVDSFGAETFSPDPTISMIGCAIDATDPVCYTITPEFLVCGLVRIVGSLDYLIVGPAQTFECNRKHAYDILVRLQQPSGRAEELLRWLHSTPICDQTRFSHVLSFLDYIINGGVEHDVTYISYKSSALSLPLADMSMPYMEHASDLFEKQVFSHVEHGDIDALVHTLDRMSSMSNGLPQLSLDGIRTYRNLFIVSSALLSRAAIRGGLNYDIANELENYYLSQIEKLDNYSDISNFTNQMMLDYTQRTAKARKVLSNSPLANKICKDIQAHIYEKSTPTAISERLKMNCSYLCRHFKKEMGKTISEYINEMKIDKCKHLLTATDMSSVQISVHLGFSSQNYMNTVFKKMTGMTPVEFRNKS